MVEEDELGHVATSTIGRLEDRGERIRHQTLKGWNADDDVDELLSGVGQRIRREEDQRQPLEVLGFLLLEHAGRRRRVGHEDLQGVARKQIGLVRVREEAARARLLARDGGRVEHVLIELEQNERNGVVEREILVRLQETLGEVVNLLAVDLLEFDAVPIVVQLMVVHARQGERESSREIDHHGRVGSGGRGRLQRGHDRMHEILGREFQGEAAREQKGGQKDGLVRVVVLVLETLLEDLLLERRLVLDVHVAVVLLVLAFRNAEIGKELFQLGETA